MKMEKEALRKIGKEVNASMENLIDLLETYEKARHDTVVAKDLDKLHTVNHHLYEYRNIAEAIYMVADLVNDLRATVRISANPEQAKRRIIHELIWKQANIISHLGF